VNRGDDVEEGSRREREGSRSLLWTPKTPKVRGIRLELSPRQVRDVLREATGADGLRELLSDQTDDLRIAIAAVMADPEFDFQRMTYTALKALSVLCAFSPRGAARGITEVSDELEMSQGTAYRYAQTFLAIGLLEQVERRRYRIPPASGSDLGEVRQPETT
jgi:IclR helix-turn-helix domain